MQMPGGSDSKTMATSTFLSERTLMKSPTPLTSSSTCHTLMRSLYHSLAGLATYLQAPLLLITPYTRLYPTSMTGMLSQRSSAIAATTTTVNDLPMSSTKSRLSSPLSKMPLPPPITRWKQHKFLLSFLTSRDMPSLMPSEDIILLNHVAVEAATIMDQELHSRAEGDVIATYW